MIRVKENARSSVVDDAVKYLREIISKQYVGWTRGGDIVVTKRRSSGQTLYEASAWLVRAE